MEQVRAKGEGNVVREEERRAANLLVDRSDILICLSRIWVLSAPNFSKYQIGPLGNKI